MPSQEESFDFFSRNWEPEPEAAPEPEEQEEKKEEKPKKSEDEEDQVDEAEPGTSEQADQVRCFITLGKLK